MANFCGKCGSKLDEKTGLCPQCDQANFLKKKKGKKAVKAFIAIVCSVSILAAGIYGALRFLNKDKVTYAYSDYNSFMEGFTDVLVTDEESAIKAIGSVADVLGITDAEKELKVVSVNNIDTDSYYRMQQYYNDIPVYGKTIVISADKNGNATALTSNTSEIINVDMEININEEEVVSIVENEYDKDVLTSTPQLIIFADPELPGKYCLAYRINVSGENILNEHFISANDGKILYSKSNILYNRVSASGIDNNDKTRSFYCEQVEENLYHLADFSKNISVYDAGKKDIQCKVNDTYDGIDVYWHNVWYEMDSWFTKAQVVQSKNNVWKNKDSVTLMANLSQVYYYYYNYFQRKGFDNENGEVFAIINDNIDGDRTNAYSISAVGLKDTVISMGADNNINLDTVAHEYTHSVIGSFLNLDNGEPGALNEGYADIMGELIEQDSSWVHGDRNIASPTSNSYPDYYKGENWVDTSNHSSNNDYGGVHKNSTVISHCAYLMWNGIDGTESNKIDFGTLSKIWYRSLMLLQDNATFSQCRNAVELSARTMLKNGALTEEQYKTVVTTFEKTGIENATFTYSETVKNKFDLSVLSSKKTENVHFELEVIKMPTIKIGPGLINNEMPELVMKKTAITGRQSLDLEDGTYVLRITDVSDERNISQSINIKIRVNGKSKDAKDEIVVNTDFTDVIVVVLNEDPSDNKEEQNADATDAILSPESAVDIYMANKHIWMENPEYMPMQRYGYCLLDLDFDGVLELINSINDGSGRYSYNKFYKINIDKQTVEEFYPEDSQDYDGIDYYYMSHQSKLLKNKSTGNLFYLFEDYCRVSTDEGIESYAEIYMKDDILYENYIFSEYWHPDYDNNTTDMIREYTFKDSDVSESEYEQKTNAYYAENTDLNLVWECVSGIDFDEGTTSTQKQLLLDAYRSYSYDGFSYDNVETYDIIKDSVSVSFESYYYSIKDGISKGYEPKLKLESDGTFVLVENLAEGMGTYTGTYLIKENCLLLSVTHVDFSGFAGEDIKTIEFTIDDQNTLTLNNDLCLSFKGDVFSTGAF